MRATPLPERVAAGVWCFAIEAVPCAAHRCAPRRGSLTDALFSPTQQSEDMNPNTEVGWWHKVYPEFKDAVTVETWSGYVVVRMPHFSAIPYESRRSPDTVAAVAEALTRFSKCAAIHEDVRWSNIGCYKTESGKMAVVIYDLGHVRSHDSHDTAWHINALAYLKETAGN